MSSWLTAGAGLLDGRIPPRMPFATAPPQKAAMVTPFGDTGAFADPAAAPQKAGIGAFGAFGTTPAEEGAFGPQKAGFDDLAIDAIKQSAAVAQSTQQPGAAVGSGATPATAIGGGGGKLPSLGGEYAVLDQYDTAFSTAASKFGVPVALLKAIAATERGWEGDSPQGATGLMQIMPKDWQGEADRLGLDYRNNPADSIMLAADILKTFSDQYGGWEQGARHYLGVGPADAFGTDQDEYWGAVKQRWDALGGGTGTQTTVGGGGIAATWGGGASTVSQEFGMTDFAAANPAIYAYSSVYSPTGQSIGHTGLDVSMDVGSKLYTPVGGVVTCGGTGNGTGDPSSGCNAFGSDQCQGGGMGCGRFEIALDNGDYLILGHMSGVTVQPGQRIDAGSFVGYSGTDNGGHVHIEYRQATPGATTSGFTIVDPRTALGAATGGVAGAGQAPASSFKYWWEL